MSTYRGTSIDAVEFNRRDDLYRLLNKDGEIVAELKRHEYLSQPQLRTMRLSNGKHRRPRAAFRGSPAGQSYFSIPSGAFFSWTPGGVTWIGADYASPAIEDAGIRAGEVIAHRCWRVVKGNRLHSAYKRKHEWLPGQPMTGDVRHEYGVHAFKEGSHLAKYIEGVRECDAVPGLYYLDFWSGETVQIEATPVAVGTIALWGEIVEHEFGYRAEFGKIASIDRVFYADDDPNLLSRLQARYGAPSISSNK